MKAEKNPEGAMGMAQAILWVVGVAIPLCWLGEKISQLPIPRVGTTLGYLVYWILLGWGFSTLLGSPKVVVGLHPKQGGPSPQQKELWGLLIWVDINLFLGCQVFLGTRKMFAQGRGWESLGICLTILAIYLLGVVVSRAYGGARNVLYRRRGTPSLCLSAREELQISFSLTQKGAPFWMAVGGAAATPAGGLILGLVALMSNVYRVIALSLVVGKHPGVGEKALTGRQILRKVFFCGPAVGLLAGMVAAGVEAAVGAPTPKILLGIVGVGAYPYVPVALFLVGTGGLWEVLTGKWTVDNRKDMVGPFLFVLGISLGIIPLAAHVLCGFLYLQGFMGHQAALGLAQFFSHAASPTAWGLIALFLGRDQAKVFLLCVMLTLAGSAISVPIIYGTCGF